MLNRTFAAVYRKSRKMLGLTQDQTKLLRVSDRARRSARLPPPGGREKSLKYAWCGAKRLPRRFAPRCASRSPIFWRISGKSAWGDALRQIRTSTACNHWSTMRSC